MCYCNLRFCHWRRRWQPTPVFLPGEFHGQKSLAGCSPWGCKELDKTKQLTHMAVIGLPGDLVIKNLPANSGDRSLIVSGRSPGEENGQPTPVFLPGKSHGQRSLVACRP